MKEYKYSIFNAEAEEDNALLAKDVLTALEETKELEKRLKKLKAFVEKSFSKTTKYLWRSSTGKVNFIPDISDSYLLNLHKFVQERGEDCYESDGYDDDRIELIEKVLAERGLNQLIKGDFDEQGVCLRDIGIDHEH